MKSQKRKLKKYEEAIEVSDIAIKCDPTKVGAYLNKSTALNKLHRYQESIELCNKIIQNHPEYPGGYYNKADALMGIGNVYSAEDLVLQAKDKH